MADVLHEKGRRAIDIYKHEAPVAPVFAVAGGVAANRAIRAGLEQLAHDNGCGFVAPPLHLCTDNAAMIAYCALELYRGGHRGDPDLVARPRWPLDRQSPAMLGGGRKGAKA